MCKKIFERNAKKQKKQTTVKGYWENFILN